MRTCNFCNSRVIELMNDTVLTLIICNWVCRVSSIFPFTLKYIAINIVSQKVVAVKGLSRNKRNLRNVLTACNVIKIKK